jgi:hypothetical protein
MTDKTFVTNSGEELNYDMTRIRLLQRMTALESRLETHNNVLKTILQQLDRAS